MAKSKALPEGIAADVAELVSIDQQIDALKAARLAVCGRIDRHCLRTVGLADERKPVEFICGDRVVTCYGPERSETRRVTVV